MKRHREDVKFHHPLHNNTRKNQTLVDGLDNSDLTDDPKHMKKLLEMLSNSKLKDKISNSKSDANRHVHRNSTIGKGEASNVNFVTNSTYVQHITNQNNYSDTVVSDILKKLQDLGEDGHSILKKVNERYNRSNDNKLNRGRQYSKPVIDFDDTIDAGRRKREIYISSLISNLNKADEENDVGVEEVIITFIYI